MANGVAGAPFGNRNAAKAKVVAEALRKCAAQEDWLSLKAGIRAVWDDVAKGDLYALQFVRDTLDGKPAQQLVAEDSEGRQLAIALIAYGSADNPLQLHPSALPAPDTQEARQRDQESSCGVAQESGEGKDLRQLHGEGSIP